MKLSKKDRAAFKLKVQHSGVSQSSFYRLLSEQPAPTVAAVFSALSQIPIDELYTEIQ